jgi:hypothetical protein
MVAYRLDIASVGNDGSHGFQLIEQDGHGDFASPCGHFKAVLYRSDNNEPIIPKTLLPVSFWQVRC